MAVETPPYGFDSGLVPFRADMTQIRTDLLINEKVSLAASGLFACVIAGSFDPIDAYKWWKITSSNQIKTAVNELIAAGYVTEVGKSLVFHETNL